MAKALYKTIFADLRRSIFAGVYKPGDMLPSEKDLAGRYGTSRVTIRNSLSMLENEHIIRSWHGKGYFVLEPQHSIYTLTFAENSSEFTPKPYNITLVAPTNEVRMALQLDPGQRVVALARVMLSGAEAAAYDLKYLPYVKGMPLVETEISFADFPSLVVNKTSPYAIRTQLEVGAALLDATTAEKLDAPPGTPALVIYRFLTDENGQRVGFGKRYLLEACGRITAYSGFN